MDYEKEFLEGKLAVNCRTENQLNKFKIWCGSIDMGVFSFEWSILGENTCCRYEKTENRLRQCNKACYISNGCKVVTYKQFMANIKAEQPEKQEYTFAEVVSRIKEGEEYVCTNSGYNIKNIKRDVVSIYFSFDHFNNFEHVNEAGIPDDARFVLKQPEHKYMNFEDAAITGKKIKYKDWTEFKTLKGVIVYFLSKNDDFGATTYNMMNQKAWEVEE